MRFAVRFHMSNILPEAFRLRDFFWDLFGTLTFAQDGWSTAHRKSNLFSWFRDIAEHSQIPFSRLLWIARFERGRRMLRGHYHVCIAGPPSIRRDLHICRAFEHFWRSRTQGLALVQPYDSARDGVGYLLKCQLSGPAIEGSQVGTDDGTAPMLSNSLIAAVRRGRM